MEYKFEAVLVSHRKVKEFLRFYVGQHVIESKKYLTYANKEAPAIQSLDEGLERN